MNPPSTPRHPIRVVAERTGLTPATLRAWERRYGAVEPGRSSGAQRLYSDADVQRLRLIARLSAIGYALSDLARSSTVTLARMARQSPEEQGLDSDAALQSARTHAMINRFLSDTRALDAVALRSGLTQTVLTLGPAAALDTVMTPFLEQVGIAWACKDVSVAQEHLASSVVRDTLGWLLSTTTQAEGAPTFLATTPAGEHHEFGAMMAAVTAAVAGWRVIYLGADLPGSEIARVARDADAKVVALSLVNPQPTNQVREQLTVLRRGLGKRTHVVAGGGSAGDHRLSIARAGIELLDRRASLATSLERVWTRAS